MGLLEDNVNNFLGGLLSIGMQDKYSSAMHKPLLSNNGVIDKVSGKRFDAQLPLGMFQDGILSPATVIPKGLKGR